MTSRERFVTGLREVFRRALSDFFKPLLVRPFWMGGAIVAATLYLYLSTGVAELATLNSRSTCVLVGELRKEAGPFVGAAASHVKILGAYAKHMKERPLSLLLAFLYPQCSPEKQLEPIILELDNAPKTEEAAQKIIAEAGQQIERFCECREGIRDRDIVWLKSERLPKWLMDDLNQAIKKSHETTERFQERRTFENALDACQANRETLLLFVLASMGYGNRDNVVQFLADVEKAHCLTSTLASETPEGESKQRLEKWAKSEGRLRQYLKSHAVQRSEQRDGADQRGYRGSLSGRCRRVRYGTVVGHSLLSHPRLTLTTRRIASPEIGALPHSPSVVIRLLLCQHQSIILCSSIGGLPGVGGFAMGGGGGLLLLGGQGLGGDRQGQGRLVGARQEPGLPGRDDAGGGHLGRDTHVGSGGRRQRARGGGQRQAEDDGGLGDLAEVEGTARTPVQDEVDPGLIPVATGLQGGAGR